VAQQIIFVLCVQQHVNCSAEICLRHIDYQMTFCSSYFPCYQNI